MVDARPLQLTAGGVLQRLAALGVTPRGVTDDSRKVEAGDLFLACPGNVADGRRHVREAIARGAVAVLWEPANGVPGESDTGGDWPVVSLAVSGLSELRGPIAHAIHGHPSERLSLVAVTGTNGKTSVAQWIAATHPRRCAVIGTLGAGFPSAMADTGFTTPQATSLVRLLADLATQQAQACAIEASSIGIAEGRLDGARVDVAAFTNLSRDHLDYHGDMEAYAAAKARLFTWPRLRLAVTNLDDPFGRELAALSTASKIIGYTQRHEPDDCPGTLRAEAVEETIDGLRFRLCAANGRAFVETRLLGRHNVSNLLAVAAVLLDAGLAPREIAERFALLSSPAGRLEQLGGNNEPLVVIDYAHSPDALENALNALRPVARARGAALSVIFGCGGDRDRGKRPLMGEVAARCADRVVLTSDNPRSEAPTAILSEISPGAPSAEIVVDRREAIRRTLLEAHPAEVVLIAGKGHEAYQEVCGVRQAFSDAAEARAALAERRRVVE